MKYFVKIIMLLCCLSGFRSLAQEVSENGTVTYITSQSIYVRFNSTSQIAIGDTLFITDDGNARPVLVVNNKSSTSCVCSRISEYNLKVLDIVYYKTEKVEEPIPEKIINEEPLLVAVPIPDTAETTEEKTLRRQQDISGRFAVSAYLNFSNTPGGNSQRMRYTTSLNAKNIGGSKLSAEYYISFIHRSDHWDDIQEDVLNGLKIYNLSLSYQFNENTRLLLGRKTNPYLSSVGAIDGVQFVAGIKSFSFGVVAGSRPDYQNYGYNPDLFQVGGYIGHEYKTDKGNMQNTLAFIDQENSWNTDRRFIYFQHSNTLLKNLYFFGSVEFDLYEYVDGQSSPTFNPTNFYLLVRYKVIKQLTLSLSYSARNNIIYYESYKEMVERLRQTSTLQGISLQAQYRPLPKLSIGAKGSYRFREEDLRPSWNADGYVTYSQVPVVQISVTGSFSYLETCYISGTIFSAGISRDIIPGKLNGGLNYRHVDYNFYTSESSVLQNMAEINFSWNIYKKLMMSVYYEGTFEKGNKFNRVYFNVTQRF